MHILSLGEKIKKLRKEKNMTLKELAGDRITAAQISHIERDKSHTSYELLDYLAKRLEVSTDYLLETKEMQAKKITDNLILQSEIYIKSDALEIAEEHIIQALQICKEYNLTDNYGKCNFLLANIHLQREDYGNAIGSFERALFFFIKNNDKKNIFKCYLYIGEVYNKEEFYKGAISHFNFAEEILDDINEEDVNLYKELYSKMASCYMKLDQPQNSLKYIEKINDLERNNSVKEEAEMIVLKAKSLFSMSNYEESKEYFRRALELIEKEEDKNKLAKIYLTISDVYSNIGDSEKVLEYSQKAYDIKKNDEDQYMLDGLFHMIQSYIDEGEHSLARKYCKLTLASSIKNKNKMCEYKSLKFYADIYIKEKEIDLAIEYISKCIAIVSNLEEPKLLANLYIELGQLYSYISKEKELEYYQKGVFVYKNLEII
ncbi:helix-turn-helix domain-containing protein [Romboutsia sp. 1001713B170207_170306_H8]|uniref:helix-turn-helix domain-containing protein n=1 Tax=Romboutsia sp. 1001713B170207_170306_H8 TaxID=2787112 RepID=UPI0008226844|nr:tetratricopeptide repeat protein [Romboutsia sp. 1001713B170207_170306_H8]SCI29170.1 ATP-dependent transcriptional regulator [uncultured Clostridium sp.]